METASVLELRKVLDSNNPCHLAIITSSVAAMATDSADDDPAPTVQPPNARFKQEKEACCRALPNPRVTDLTNRQPLVKPESDSATAVLGGADKFCDLTTDGDAVWTELPKKRIKVE